MKTTWSNLKALGGCWLVAGLLATPTLANIPGGGTGTGPNVTVVNNGNGTVTMANGTCSILINISGASITQINYTYNNGGGAQTQQLLANGKDGGEFYWEFGGFGGNPWVYNLVANTGGYAEVDLYSDSATNGAVDIHFSMLRGSPGFFVTGIWSHRAQDAAQGTGEERDNIYIAPYFNWMSVDGPHDRELGLNYSSVPSFYSPQENSLTTSGILEGTYDDKYKFCADWGVERVWGWSSVSDAREGFTGQNVGIWHVLASSEYYNGGPLKPELMDAPMVNMINGGHYYMGNDSGYGNGEPWTRVSGPYFIYLNNVTNTLTDPVQTSRALWADAQAQAAAEQTAWPYSWFVNTNYALAAQRGTVNGTMVIHDPYNPNATASNLWVGVVQQPITIDNVYDFQQWEKPYQFWVRSDANGNFSIPNVVAGNNYTLYAFGQGAAGTFMSHAQTGGNPPLIFNTPASPFYVTVTGGATNNLGNVTWTPTRYGPTVFEIGYPDRKSDKFRHGDDYWVGDIGPSPSVPSPIWTKFMEYPYDFPNGVTYVVGQNRWNTDWNFIQPPVFTYAGVDVASSSTINFNLAAAPAGGVTAALFLGLCSDDNGPIIVTVNGAILTTSSAGVSGAPNNSIPTSGYFPGYSDNDTDIREENHASYSDEFINFPASLLHAGTNTINIGIRMAAGASFYNHAMYDYLRLELPGYVPPPPAGVTAWPGNNQVLLSWPVAPGATSYKVLRSTIAGGGFVPLTNGFVGPVCGSGPANATYVDNSAVNGAAYYYAVQSVNPTGVSANSPASAGVTPSGGLAASAPSAPTGLTATSNNVVMLTWSAVPGANYYTVYRGTVVNRLGYVPFYIILSNTTTNTTYVDASGTLGCTYSYYVTATSAAGSSGASPAVTAVPIPPAPAAPPGNVQISDTITSSNETPHISWSPVPGAVGYILYRCTNSTTGPFSFPGEYVQSMTTGNYTDAALPPNALYSYMVVAMNAGGVSGNSVVVSTPPAAPASLNAYPGNGQITLVWAPSAGASSYTLKRGASSGNETTTVITTTNTTWSDTGLVNGTTYYYTVTASGSSGSSINSPEASTAPFAGPPAIYWVNAITAAPQSWNVNSNWSNGTAFPNAAEAAAIINAPIAAAQTINLNQPITAGIVSLGSAGGAFTVAGNGGALTLDNTPGQPVLDELTASKGDLISAPVTLNGNLIISNTSASALTLAGAISGANGLTVAGPGSVILSGTNTYSGVTTVGAGTLQLNNGASAGTNVIFLTGGGTLYENNVSFPNVISNSGTNTWTCYASGTIYPGASLAGTGQLNLNITGNGVFSPGGDWSQFAGTLAWAPGNGAACRLYGTLGSANASWNLGTSTANIYNRNGGVTISFGALTGGSGTSITGASTATALTTYSIGALGLNSTFNGRIGDGGGPTAVSKVGSGALTLTATNNNYSGGTTISAGTLLVNNAAGTGAGTGLVTVNSGGALGGTGILTGAVTVNFGGAFTPGNPLGTLIISNNLTLAAGSTSYFQVQHAPPANSAAIVSGTLARGGTLYVTNSGGVALAEGDSFKLFGAGAYAGNFASVILPPLPAGLGWNTNALATNGAISVVVTTRPVIGAAALAGGGLRFSGGAGVAGANFYLLGSTNLATPLTNWTRLLTNQFDGSGNFNFTNLLKANAQQSFYQLEVP